MRISEHLSNLTEHAKRTEEIIDAARVKKQDQKTAKTADNTRTITGWLVWNGIPSLLVGTAAVMRYHGQRARHHGSGDAHRDHRGMGLLPRDRRRRS